MLRRGSLDSGWWVAPEKGNRIKGPWEQKSLSSVKDMLSGRSMGDFPEGGVQEEMNYKSQSPEVGSGESLAKNVRDMGAKPGEEGVSESPGGGGGNCKLHILLLTHTYTHTEHGSRIWRFPDSISNFFSHPTVDQELGLEESWGPERVSEVPPQPWAPRSYQLKCPGGR